MDNGYIYEYRLVILNSDFLNASTNETESFFLFFGEGILTEMDNTKEFYLFVYNG